MVHCVGFDVDEAARLHRLKVTPTEFWKPGCAPNGACNHEHGRLKMVFLQLRKSIGVNTLIAIVKRDDNGTGRQFVTVVKGTEQLSKVDWMKTVLIKPRHFTVKLCCGHTKAVVFQIRDVVIHQDRNGNVCIDRDCFDRLIIQG